MNRDLRMLYRELPEVVGCKQCGTCCGTTQMHVDEVARILKKLEQDGRTDLIEKFEALKKYVNDPKAFPLDRNEGIALVKCRFLDQSGERKRCAVHEERGFICRIFGATTGRGICPFGAHSLHPLSEDKAASLVKRYYKVIEETAADERQPERAALQRTLNKIGDLAVVNDSMFFTPLEEAEDEAERLRNAGK